MEKSGIGIYRAKDIFVEAVQYDGTHETANQCANFAFDFFTFEYNGDAGYALFKDHNDNPLIAQKGDYIVKLGESYVILSEYIFNQIFVKHGISNN